MWKKYRHLQKIVETGLVLIIRSDDENEARNVAEAAIDGGVKALEITLSAPNALSLIRSLSTKYRKEVLIGAGTVLDAEAASQALMAGAELLVSPQLNPEMIRMANRYQAITISGAFTPTEMVQTMEAGADMIKLFPAEAVSPSFIKAIKAPLSQAAIVPTGGVRLENIEEWFNAGSTAVGIGNSISKLARPDGNYTRVSKAVQQYLQAIAEAKRNQM